MKILYLIDGLRQGGKERRALELIKELAKDPNYEIILCIMNNDVHYDEVYNLNIKVIPIIRKSKFDLQVLKKIYEIIKSFNPDIVQCWDTLSTLSTIIPAKILRRKLITAKISDSPVLYKKNTFEGILSELCFWSSDRIVANSYAGVKAYGVPEKKSRVIYNGIDLTRKDKILDEISTRKKYNLTASKTVIMVARMDIQKDYDTYFKAAEMVIDEYKDVMFLAVGGGPLFEQFKLKINDKYKNNILLLGKCSDVESIVNVSDIGVLATYTEGISNSIMEYMLFAKPVVATIGGGTAELVEDNANGFLVPQKSPEKLYENIMKLLKDDDLRVKMGNNGYEKILTKFNIKTMTQNFINTYKNIKE